MDFRPGNDACLGVGVGGALRYPQVGPGTPVEVVVSSNGQVYAGGGFRGMGGKPQSYIAGISAPVPVGVDEGSAWDTSLMLNSPPSNPARVEIRYVIGRPGNYVQLGIYDVAGRSVRSFQPLPATLGEHVVLWNGLDRQGVRPARGVYFVRLEAPGRSVSKKLVLVRD